MSAIVEDFVRKNSLNTDDIRAHFSSKSLGTNCEVRPCDDPNWRMQLVSPENPLNPVNLEYRYNWQIVKVEGVDEDADEELSLESSKFSDGTRIKGSKKNEREIKVTIRVCPCDDCDYLEQRGELYKILKCKGCAFEDCQICCDSGTLNVNDFIMKDLRYCHLRIQCCGVIRQIPVKKKGKIESKRMGQCYYYTVTYLSELPDYHYPRVQTYEFKLDPETDATCPKVLSGVVDLKKVQGFKKIIEFPYDGTSRSWPKFTIKGSVTSLKITNLDTGAVVSLDKNGPYTIDGCAPTILNFWRGVNSYTDNAGRNIYQDLIGGCQNQFYFDDDCDGVVRLCVEGKFVDFESFFMKIQWWLEYDGFFDSGVEPSQTIKTVCEECACITQDIYTVDESEVVNACFEKTITVPHNSQDVMPIKFVWRGDVSNLKLTNKKTGEQWCMDDNPNVLYYDKLKVGIFDSTIVPCGLEQAGQEVVESCGLPEGALYVQGDTEFCITGDLTVGPDYCITGKIDGDKELKVDPRIEGIADLQLEFSYDCEGQVADAC